MRNKYVNFLVLFAVIFGFKLFGTETNVDNSDNLSQDHVSLSEKRTRRWKRSPPKCCPKAYMENGVTLAVEALYWQLTDEENGYWASTATSTPPSEGGRGIIPSVNWQYKWGFRGILGYNVPYDNWDLFGIYTRIRWNNHSNFYSADRQPAMPFWFSGEVNPTTAVNAAHFTTNYHLQHLDIEVGKNFFIPEYLHVRPHFGVRGTYDKQQTYVSLEDFVANSGNFVANAFERSTDDIRAIGMKIGADTNWYVFCNWSFVANINFIYSYARHKLAGKIDQQNFSNGQVFTLMDVATTLHSMIPQTELKFAVQWDDWFYDQTFQVSTSLGWEFMYYDNANAEIGGSGVVHYTSVSIQGLTYNLSFQF